MWAPSGFLALTSSYLFLIWVYIRSPARVRVYTHTMLTTQKQFLHYSSAFRLHHQPSIIEIQPNFLQWNRQTGHSSFCTRKFKSLFIIIFFCFKYRSGQGLLTEFIGMESSKKRKRRTSFTPQALEILNSHFEHNTHPSGRSDTTRSPAYLQYCVCVTQALIFF
jgi:hypothetical protein